MSMKTNEAAAAAGGALEELAGQAEALGAVPGDGTEEGGAPEAPAAVVPSNQQLLAGIIEAVRDGFCAFTSLSTPRAILTTGSVESVAGAWAKVLDNRGISLHDYLGKNSDVLSAIIVTAPIAMALYRAVGAEHMTRQAMTKPKDAEPAASPEAAKASA